ncbi:hypothetical protein DVH24_021973 [Malus domestica]|uniref:Uncharacterized protein n=1 Tax=Malus domestica TaxID=3750 RepID=A0A498IU38_MALDO|nr:hypothetical protein DVH24_021973 [Malus domestica]
MEVDQQVLHMNGGVGKTSYATNSLLQRAAISMVKPIKASIEQLCSKLSSDCLKIADFGFGGLITKEGEGLNKKNIYIAKTSPPAVYKQYLEQFKKDFRVFLRSQAEELVPGRSMVITTLGSTKSHDPLSIWEVVGLKLNNMVLEGLIEEEKLDTFNMPLYFPTTKEAEDVIEEEGFFTLQSLEVFKNDWDSYIKHADSGLDKKARAAVLATEIRAVVEPLLATQFGEVAMDDLFRRFEEDVLDHMEMEN